MRETDWHLENLPGAFNSDPVFDPGPVVTMNTTKTVDMCVSIYGDGALLDALVGDWILDLRTDDETDEDGNDNPTARIRLVDVPLSIADRAVDYCRNDNNGKSEPYSDGYEAMECINAAGKSSVWSCDVPWSTAECQRLGGCYLCGGNHDEDCEVTTDL